MTLSPNNKDNQHPKKQSTIKRIYGGSMLKSIMSLVANLNNIKKDSVVELLKEYAGSKLGDKLQWFIDTGETAQLKLSTADMIGTWIHKSKIVKVPVLKVHEIYKVIGGNKEVVDFTTKVVWSNTHNDGVDPDSKEFVGIFRSRDWIPNVLKMTVEKPTVRVMNEQTGFYEDRVVYSPENIGEYKLISAMNKKSMYMKEIEIPSYIQKFVDSADPKVKNDLGTLLKRQGKELECFSNLSLYKERKAEEMYGKNILKEIYAKLADFDVIDWGKLILNKKDWKALTKELGEDPHSPLQGTLVGDNWYFKGAFYNTEQTGLKPGYYGGIKKANKDVVVGKAIFGSVFSNFTSEPWKTTVNRQISDYTPGFDFPVVTNMINKDDSIKAHIGLESKRIQYNYNVLSNIKQTLNKAELSPNKSWAGKITVINTDGDYNFVIKGNTKKIKKLNGKIIDMAMLIFPWLAIYRHLSKVRVKFVYDKKIDNHLIMANVGSGNITWLAVWLMSFYGRDFDGDGICLTSDPRVLKHAVLDLDNESAWIDTTAVKQYESPVMYKTSEDAVKAAEQMIKLGSKLIGKYDKTIRRIIYKHPEVVTPVLCKYVAYCIQMAISSQKKTVAPTIQIEGKKYNWKNTSWIWRAGFMTKEEFSDVYKKNPHDAMDLLTESINDFITSDITYRKLDRKFQNQQASKLERNQAKELLIANHDRLESWSKAIPESHKGAVNNLMTLLLKSEHVGNELVELYGAADKILLKYDGTNNEEQMNISTIMWEIRALAKSVVENDDDDDNSRNISYDYVGKLINHKLATYTGNREWLTAEIIKKASVHMLGYLDLKWLSLVGYKLKIRVPSVKCAKLGKLVTKGQLMAVQAAYRDIPEGSYKIEAVDALENIQWFTKKGDHKSSGYMITLRQQ